MWTLPFMPSQYFFLCVCYLQKCKGRLLSCFNFAASQTHSYHGSLFAHHCCRQCGAFTLYFALTIQPCANLLAACCCLVTMKWKINMHAYFPCSVFLSHILALLTNSFGALMFMDQCSGSWEKKSNSYLWGFVTCSNGWDLLLWSCIALPFIPTKLCSYCSISFLFFSSITIFLFILFSLF